MYEGKDGFAVPEYQKNFLPYGDEAAFRKYVNDPTCEGPDVAEGEVPSEEKTAP